MTPGIPSFHLLEMPLRLTCPKITDRKCPFPEQDATTPIDQVNVPPSFSLTKPMGRSHSYTNECSGDYFSLYNNHSQIFNFKMLVAFFMG